MARIQLQEVTKVYPDGTEAVSALDLDIADGEAMVLVGPSGCGKTTALQMIAGLEAVSNGSIAIDGNVVNNVPAKDRDIAMVFQNYALYPHMTVYENMAFGLKLRKVPRAEIDKRVRSAASTLGLQDMLTRKPRLLSGGQRQRVAMGRAIVREPKAFLMDEPLSNLDARLRVHMRAEISRLQRNLGITTIYVTHDQVEAMTIGDRAAIMRCGKLQQVDTPHNLYQHPANVFVAAFIGSPGMNIFEATIRAEADRLFVDFGDSSLPLAGETLAMRPALHGCDGRKVTLGIRPEDVEDAALVADPDPAKQLDAVVDLREELGPHVLAYLDIGAPSVVSSEIKELASDIGAYAMHELEQKASEGQSVFLAQLAPRTMAREGQPIRVLIDTSRLYFFDIDSGAAIYR